MKPARCPICSGTGKSANGSCNGCRGVGWVSVAETRRRFSITITPAVRSALRSALFNIVIPLAAYFALDEGAALVGYGLDPVLACSLSVVVGALLRAYAPNVGGPRPTA